VLGAGCSVLGAPCCVLGAECWVLGAGCCVLGAERCVLGAGCSVVGARCFARALTGALDADGLSARAVGPFFLAAGGFATAGSAGVFFRFGVSGLRGSGEPF
jgi:hypothetical protein